MGNIEMAEQLIKQASHKLSSDQLIKNNLLHSLFSSPPSSTSSIDSFINLTTSLIDHKVPVNTKDSNGMTRYIYFIFPQNFLKNF